MGTGVGTTHANRILNATFGVDAAANMPATYYVALMSASPANGAGGTELSGNGYARVAVTNNATNFAAAAGGVKTNATDIAFPTATGDWADAAYWAIYDASSGGNLCHYGNFDSVVSVDNGQDAVIDAGALVITVTL